MQSEITRARIIKGLYVAVPLLALIFLLAPRGPSSSIKHMFSPDKSDFSAMPDGNAFTSSPRPGQPGQEVPWHVLPQGSYTLPNSGRGARRWPYAADAAVDLPLSSDTLYLTAHGAGFSGVVNIDGDGRSGADTARVDVRMYYTAAHLAGASKALREQPSAGKNGIAIKTPMRCGQNEQMFFDVRVHLPPGTPQDPQRISNLETDLPNFAHVLGDLAKGVHFGRISLRGANDRISSKSLLADIAQIQTSNGPIEGKYSSTNQLNLKTDNGQVDTEVTLMNDGRGRTSVLDLGTSNGQISATISLLSTAQGGTGGAFHTKAHTSNAGLALTVARAPRDSVQRVDAQGANGDVAVALPAAFEGAFRLAQSFGAPAVQRSGAADPAGAGRARNVRFGQDRRGDVSGSASWGEPGGGRMGNVDVETSNGDVRLVL